MTRTAAFTREQMRAPLTLVLLVAVPVVFVVASASVLQLRRFESAHRETPSSVPSAPASVTTATEQDLSPTAKRTA